MSDLDRVVTRMEHIREELEETVDVRERAKLQREYRALRRTLEAHTKHGAYEG